MTSLIPVARSSPRPRTSLRRPAILFGLAALVGSLPKPAPAAQVPSPSPPAATLPDVPPPAGPAPHAGPETGAPRSPDRPRRPAYLRVVETMGDFGVSVLGEEVRYVFRFHNDGDEPMHIRKARPT